MSDIFDDFNKVLKKDLVPILVKYFNDPNNKITDNFNDFLNDPQAFLKDIFEKFSKNNDTDNKPVSYIDIENVSDEDPAIDDEYAELFKRLTVIEENMIKIEKILKDKN